MDIEAIMHEAGQANAGIKLKITAKTSVFMRKEEIEFNKLVVGVVNTYDDGSKTTSCLTCLAFLRSDQRDHVVECHKKSTDPSYCSICLVKKDESHIYSNNHAIEVAKMRVILEQNNGKIGVASGGELVIDLRGANIVGTYDVSGLANRLSSVEMPKPGGLAAFHLKSAILAATGNNSASKKLAENSTVVQTLLQVCLISSAGHVPCPTSTRITYTLNGYSVLEMIGALKNMYPDEYVYALEEKFCMLHNKLEKTLVFKDAKRTYNQTLELIAKLTSAKLEGIPVDKKVDGKKSKN